MYESSSGIETVRSHRDIDIMVDIGLLLIGLSNLKELNLSDCNLSMETFNDKSLGQYLYITDDQGSDAVSMIDMIKLSKIRYLDIRENKFSIEDIEQMNEAFKDKDIRWLYTEEEEEDLNEFN